MATCTRLITLVVTTAVLGACVGCASSDVPRNLPPQLSLETPQSPEMPQSPQPEVLPQSPRGPDGPGKSGADKHPADEPLLIRLSARDVDPLKLKGPEPPLAEGQAGLYAVQFRSVITARTWEVLQGAGAVVGPYTADLTFVVRMTPAQARSLAENQAVRAVVRWRPEWKLEPGLPTGGRSSFRLVAFPECQPQLLADVQKLGAPEARIQGALVIADLPATVLKELARSENLLYIEERHPERIGF